MSDRAVGGGRIVAADVVATVTLVVACIGGVTVRSLRPVAAAAGLLLFVAGTTAFLGALWRAAQRSRTELLSVGGLLLGGETAPRRIRTRLYALLAAQTVTSIVASSLRPYTVVAFSVLAPMAGLGAVALWAAVHGAFPARPARPGRRRPPTATRRPDPTADGPSAPETGGAGFS